MTTLQFKHCKVDIYPEREYTETVFEDGSVVEASPMDYKEYRDSAKEHGYGDDLFLFCLHHEIFHTVLAETKGLDYSPVLWDVAHGIPDDNWRHWKEEKEVMEFQKLVMKIMEILK